MGKKNKNQRNKQKTAVAEKPRQRFEPRDILCVLAAMIFIGTWVYHKEIAELNTYAMAIAYLAIFVLLGVYFLVSPKFQETWKKWDKGIKRYFIILILADVLAFVSYDIMSNILYMLAFAVLNFLYYVLFLRGRTDSNERNNSKNKKIM